MKRRFVEKRCLLAYRPTCRPTLVYFVTPVVDQADIKTHRNLPGVAAPGKLPGKLARSRAHFIAAISARKSSRSRRPTGAAVCTVQAKNYSRVMQGTVLHSLYCADVPLRNCSLTHGSFSLDYFVVLI